MLTGETFWPNSFYKVAIGLQLGGVVGGGISPLEIKGDFLSVRGLDMEFEFETYKEGGGLDNMYFYRGTVPQTLVLERGVVDKWFMDIFMYSMVLTKLGCSIQFCGQVQLNDIKGSKVRAWDVAGLWPSKYSATPLDANKSSFAVERLELTYNGALI